MPWRKACVAVRVHIGAGEHFAFPVFCIDKPKLVLRDGKKPSARRIDVDDLGEVRLLAGESIEYSELSFLADNLSVHCKARLVRLVESSQHNQAAVRARNLYKAPPAISEVAGKQRACHWPRVPDFRGFGQF